MSLSVLSSKIKRASTRKSVLPSRIEAKFARSPVMSLTADKSAVLPAPVSPVRTVRPQAGRRRTSLINARF